MRKPYDDLEPAEQAFWDHVEEVQEELFAWVSENSRFPDGTIDPLTFGAAAAHLTGTLLSCLPHEVGWEGLRVMMDAAQDSYAAGRKIAQEQGQDEAKH